MKLAKSHQERAREALAKLNVGEEDPDQSEMERRMSVILREAREGYAIELAEMIERHGRNAVADLILATAQALHTRSTPPAPDLQDRLHALKAQTQSESHRHPVMLLARDVVRSLSDAAIAARLFRSAGTEMDKRDAGQDLDVALASVEQVLAREETR